MRTYLIHGICLNLTLISLSAFMVPTCAGQLTVDVLPPMQTPTIFRICETPSFDPGSDQAGLERALQVIGRESIYVPPPNCYDNARLVGADLANECTMAGSPLAGWHITQVGTVQPCHSGTIISSPSGRYYYLDHINPFLSCMSDVVEMMVKSFDRNGNPRIWTPKPGEVNKMTFSLISFCRVTGPTPFDFQLDGGPDPINFQCTAPHSVPSIGSASATSSVSGDSECLLPVQTGSVRVFTVASYDPNAKVGSAGVGPQQYLSASQPSPYAIAFENVASATAPAQSVTVTDQLDTAHLDLSTFALGPMGFGNQQIVPPPGLSQFSTYVDLRPSVDLIVAIKASLNKATGTAVWSFDSLDPSTGQPPTGPLVGFLPPNVVPPQGDGQVLFSVSPKGTLNTGQQISNSASVVFDVNPPISTATWFNTVDNSAPVSHVLPLPTDEATQDFIVQWTGTDVGSGIANFTVFVSDNGGPFTAFQTNTTATSATFNGQPGHTYGFYSIARDLVGNIEPAKTSAEATTQVTTDTTPPVTIAAVSQAPNANGWNNTNVTVTLNSTDSEPAGTGVRQITFSATGAQTIASTIVNGTSASFTINIEGITTISFFGTDNAGNVESAHTLTIQLDKTPPTVACSASPNVLWPPNNKPVPINVSVDVSDSLSGPAGFTLVSVTSNEPDSGQGDIQGFVTGTASTTGQVRAHRLGSGTGRVYTFTYSGSDRAGNTASCITTVSVPHDQGH